MPIELESIIKAVDDAISAFRGRFAMIHPEINVKEIRNETIYVIKSGIIKADHLSKATMIKILKSDLRKVEHFFNTEMDEYCQYPNPGNEEGILIGLIEVAWVTAMLHQINSIKVYKGFWTTKLENATTALFCNIVSESGILPQLYVPNKQFCIDVCTKYGIPVKEKVRTLFSTPDWKGHTQKVVDLILPNIDQYSRETIIQYLAKRSENGKLYG